MNEKGERERDITLVSEQHTKVNIAGLSTVQSTVVCRNSANRGATTGRRLRQEVNSTVLGCERGQRGEKGTWGEGGGTGGMDNIQ